MTLYADDLLLSFYCECTLKPPNHTQKDTKSNATTLNLKIIDFSGVLFSTLFVGNRIEFPQTVYTQSLFIRTVCLFVCFSLLVSRGFVMDFRLRYFNLFRLIFLRRNNNKQN